MLKFSNVRVLRSFIPSDHADFAMRVIKLMYSFLGLEDLSTTMVFSSSNPITEGKFTLGVTQKVKGGYKILIYCQPVFFISPDGKGMIQLMRVVMHELHHVEEDQTLKYASEIVAEAHESLYKPFYNLFMWLVQNRVHLTVGKKTKGRTKK